MTHYEILTAILSLIGVLLLPLIGIMVRGMIRWVRTEDSLKTLIETVKTQTQHNDKVHEEMYKQMRLDREATNQRLYYLEKIWIERGLGRR